MSEMHDEVLWQRITAALFKPRKIKDERLFTANVMARVRQLEPMDVTWPVFARWAIPVLALSFGSFILSVSHYIEPRASKTEAVILGDKEASTSIDWVANAPDTDDSDEEVANS